MRSIVLLAVGMVRHVVDTLVVDVILLVEDVVHHVLDPLAIDVAPLVAGPLDGGEGGGFSGS